MGINTIEYSSKYKVTSERCELPKPRLIILPLKYLFVGQSLMLEIATNSNPFFAKIFFLSYSINCSIKNSYLVFE